MKEALEAHKLNWLEHDKDYEAMFTYNNEQLGGYHIFIRPTTSIGDIAHEAVHATNRILADSGVIFSVENDEIYAYLTGYIVNKINDYLKKRDKTNGNRNICLDGEVRKRRQVSVLRNSDGSKESENGIRDSESGKS